MFHSVFRRNSHAPLAMILTLGALLSTALAQSPPAGSTPPTTPAAKPAPANYRYLATQSPHTHNYYAMVWGIDDLKVKSVESGELIRFNYRVIDPARAQVLNDKKLEPLLYDQRAGVKLVIPSMEKVGQLRQSSTPEQGRVYWMAFSNKGRLVKPGDRVTVVIGNFHAEGLIVE